MSYNSKYTGKQVEEILDKANSSTNVTESTVANWGFTKNTGTYSKPSSGIPKSDLASAVQTSLGKADTALQSVPSEYVTETELNNKGYATSSQLNTGFADAERKFTAINEEMDNKQPKLVSGTNIKTINGNNITGSGNVNTEYPVITVSNSSVSMKPNTYYRLTTGQSSLTITFQNPTYSNIVNEYVIEFVCGGTVSVPDTIVWAGGKVPTFEEGKTYLLSVVNNLGLVAKFE